ncbi:MAG: hypothetical protein ABI679_05485 [Gemmatimonadota bacterium]
MFLGHYGVAFALKRTEPRLSLGTLFLAVFLVDLMWGIFLITGWEQARINPELTRLTSIEFLSFPYSHGLLAGVLWAVLAAAITYSWPTRDTSRHHWIKAAIVGGAVLSHWFLDLVVHLPDLPLINDESRKVGFGLWRSLPLTLVVEALVFFGGVVIYAQWRHRGGNTRPGRLGVLVGVLIAIYAASILSPPPSRMTMVGIMCIVGSLALVAMAVWVDQRAQPVAAEARGHAPSKRSHRKA